LDRNHSRKFGQMQEELVGRARNVAANAVSWRGFNVGCAVLAHDGKRYAVFTGCNAKPLQHGPKICAEQVAVMSAVSAGFTVIVGMVVAGEPQEDGSGIKHPTLRPCEACLSLLTPIPAVKQTTAVITVCNHIGPRETHTWQGLLDSRPRAAKD